MNVLSDKNTNTAAPFDGSMNGTAVSLVNRHASMKTSPDVFAPMMGTAELAVTTMLWNLMLPP